jgi:hypothetical protein
MPSFPFLLGLWLVFAAWPAQAGPHEHGVAHLNVAIDGQRVTLSFQIPMESLLGHERAPKSPQEQAQVKAAYTGEDGKFVYDALIGDGAWRPAFRRS